MDNSSKDNKNDIVVLSVGAGHTMAQEATVRRNFTLLRDIGKCVLSDTNIVGDASDYHNLATQFARVDDYHTAFKLVVKGLGQYPYNIDLLSGAVNYGAKSKHYEECEKYIAELMSRPYGIWNWRAFTFLIDYYKSKPDWIEAELIGENYKKALNLAIQYQQSYPNEEKGYLAESEIRLLIENFIRCTDQPDAKDKSEEQHQLAEKVLKQAVDSEKFTAVQCCLTYADQLFEERRYLEAIEVCEKALQYGESQPSARIGYFVYLAAQSKDVLIQKDKAFTDKGRIQDTYADYAAAYQALDVPTYKENIKNRILILSAKSGIKIPDSMKFDDESMYKFL